MARYLTPSKLALLALVSIYSEGVVPNSAIVALLSFFMSHLLPLDSQDSKSRILEGGAHTISIKEFEEVTSSLTSSIPGRTVWDLFLKRLWQLDCLDSLEEFFGLVSDLVTKTREDQLRDQNSGMAPEPGKMRFSRTSPLGMFIRRAQLEYARLQFHDSVALWRAFIRYRMPTYYAWAKRNPMDSQTKVDVNLVELGLDVDSPLAKVVYGDLENDEEDTKVSLSTKDMERLLEFQVEEMQSKGTRVTEEMRKRLRQMLASGVAVPSLSHYVRFLDSWRAGDYPSSFDNLHRYFDYAMHNRDRACYQYALLNLATLQADFGCLGEAVSAMQEAISIARETQDMHCLNYCMSWLYHCRKAWPSAVRDVQNTGMLGSDREALAFLQAKARENEMWGLLSTSILAEAKLELCYGESISSVFEHVTKAAHLNATQNLNPSMGQLLVIQAVLFMRLGASHLAMAMYDVFRECYSEDAIFDDYLNATFRSSHLLFFSGNHSKAMQQLEEVASNDFHSLKSQQIWTFAHGLLKLRQQIHRDDKVAVEHLISQLQACVPSEPDQAISLSLLQTEFFISKGDYSSALRSIEQVAKSTQQGNFDVSLQIGLLNLKARVFQNTDQPERAFSLVMRAASIAYRARVLPGLWEALGNLAVILIAFQEFDAAADILESIMPQVLEGEDCMLGARTYSLLADANMGLAGRNKHDGVRQKEHIARASEFIDCAFEGYSKAEDVRGQCEMTSKKATLMHLSGDLALANDYAARYLDLKKAG
ncbi:anaphase-promoting complex subunit 5 [Coccidioides immitis RMSCC 2394]|uniref:Anaphase-promoting complex subunit 5 n=1 Tax=Coccidioides immitis RMSCC 2394 TaxID=404692 RepID=A0A0J6XXW4_COCIT|nr:anaphase-promoting complex subunit 5 [Coccidioides immitis RMSCC 2394]